MGILLIRLRREALVGVLIMSAGALVVVGDLHLVACYGIFFKLFVGYPLRLLSKGVVAFVVSVVLLVVVDIAFFVEEREFVVRNAVVILKSGLMQIHVGLLARCWGVGRSRIYIGRMEEIVYAVG